MLFSLREMLLNEYISIQSAANEASAHPVWRHRGGPSSEYHVDSKGIFPEYIFFSWVLVREIFLQS